MFFLQFLTFDLGEPTSTQLFFIILFSFVNLFIGNICFLSHVLINLLFFVSDLSTISDQLS